MGNQEINNFCLTPTVTCGMNVVSNIVQPQCLGIENGSISVSVSGGVPGYSYSWDGNLGNTNSISNLSPGNYTLTISDSLLCDTIINYDLNYLTNLNLTNNSYNVSCNGANDGYASVVASGSNGFMYDWGAGYTYIIHPLVDYLLVYIL